MGCLGSAGKNVGFKDVKWHKVSPVFLVESWSVYWLSLKPREMMHICYSKWGPTNERDLGCLVSLSWVNPWNSTRFGLFWTKTTPDRYPKDMFQTYVLALTNMWYMIHYHQSTHHQHRSMQNNLIACCIWLSHIISFSERHPGHRVW